MVLLGLGTIGLLAILIAIATAAIVLSGATEVGLIRDRVQAKLEQKLGPAFEVTVAGAAVSTDPELGLVVDLRGIELAERDGGINVSFPATRLAVDPLAFLGFGSLVTKAEISEPLIQLTRRPDGGFGLRSFGQASGSRVEAPYLSAGGFPKLSVGAAGLDQAITEILADNEDLQLVVTQGAIELRDPAAPTTRISEIDVRAAGDGPLGGLSVDLSARGRSGPWTASLGRQVEAATGQRILSVEFAQITLGDLRDWFGGAPMAASADIPLYGAAEIALAANGTIENAVARLDLGAGVISFGGSEEAVLLDEASIRARWDNSRSAIVIEPSSIHFGDTGGSYSGVVQDKGDGRYAFAVESRDSVLAPRDSTEPPLPAELVELSGSVDLPARQLNLDRIILHTGAGSFAAAGRLGFTGETPSLVMAAELTPMAVGAFKQMWPPFLAPGARRWVFRNIVEGRIASARLDAAVPAGVLFRRDPPKMAPDAFKLDFRLEDVTVRTYGGLPPISAAAAHGVLAGSTLGVDLESGIIRTASGATLGVDAGAFAIDNVFNPKGEAVIEVEFGGDAAILGEIANSEPFFVLDRRGLAPRDLSGKGEVRVSVRLPLDIEDRDEAGSLVDWTVTVDGTGLASKQPIGGRTFSDADVMILVNKHGLTVDGTAEIDGVPAAVSVAQPLAEDGVDAAGAQQAAVMALDREARLKLGLDVEDILSGVVDAQVRNLDGRDGQHYDLDLRRARLAVPGLGWSKGIGVPATMRFDVIPEPGGSRIENMELEGDGFGFVGSARLADGEGLVAASIEKFHLRDGDDVAFELTREGAGYRIVARGASFDVRGAIAELKGDVEDGGDTSNVTVDARIGRMLGFNDRRMNDAEVSLVVKDGVPLDIKVAGKMRGSTVSLVYRDELERASLEASAGDAGAVFDFLDIYGRIGGGHLAIVAERPAPTGPLAGTMSMTSFAVLNEPAMEEVVSRAQPRNAAKIDTTRMHVEQMDAVFRYTGDEIFVDEAFFRGAAIGATFNGVFDLVQSFVSMSGTYIPVYGINNAFSRVPVVGRILGGENAEGLIGVTFKVEGPIDAPRVFVNPLSAVAPGIFRKIFEFR